MLQKSLEEFNAELQRNRGKITPAILQDAFLSSESERNFKRGLFHRYKCEKLNIFNSVTEGFFKNINNKIHNDFRGTIVKSFVGYVFGNPVKYSLKPEMYYGGFDSKEFKDSLEFFEFFLDDNDFVNLDLESATNISICGNAARIIYISDGSGFKNYPRYKIKNINPQECVFIYNPSTNELDYTFRFYKIKNVNIFNLTKTESIVAEVYDRVSINYYISDDVGKSWRVFSEEVVHNFGFVPLFEIKNNSTNSGDFQNVESLINAYDKAISDNQNEIEALRNTYLISKGTILSGREELEKIKQTGVFNLQENDEISFLSKNTNSQQIEHQLELLRKNIFRFSSCIDVYDETFLTSGSSGIARQWAMLPFENTAKIKESYFKSALTYQFNGLSTLWQKVGLKIDLSKISITFSRNIPKDLSSEADLAQKLSGIVSKRTVLENLSLIENADDELARIEDEKKSSNLDLLSVFEGQNPKELSSQFPNNQVPDEETV
jgi:SPP1 family phage portal protein